MKKGCIIVITKNFRVPQLENLLFLVVSEKSDTVLKEDGTEGNGHFFFGYTIAQTPIGQFRITSPTKHTILVSDIQYTKVAECIYVDFPYIISIHDVNNEFLTAEEVKDV